MVQKTLACTPLGQGTFGTWQVSFKDEELRLPLFGKHVRRERPLPAFPARTCCNQPRWVGSGACPLRSPHDSLDGTWSTSSNPPTLVRVDQIGDMVTTVAEWGTGQGVADVDTSNTTVLKIYFSNNPTTLRTGVVGGNSSCISWGPPTDYWIRSSARADPGAMARCKAPPAPPPAPSERLPAVPAPEWTAHTVIYEIAPKVFTSPNGTGSDGSGSGTFASAAGKLAELAELGITAIWLAGWASSNAFLRGIWTTYGAVNLGQIDPSLGGAAGFKTFMSTAHVHGIKVILDVTTHGVVPGSPLIRNRPEYFRANLTGEYRMVDYNYTSPEWRQYWPSIFIDLVKRYKVDGFRLDMGMQPATSWHGPFSDARPLWDEVALAANASGHPIVIMPELGETYHFKQIDTQPTVDMPAAYLSLMAKPLAPKLCRASVQISCHDTGKPGNRSGNYFQVQGSRAKLGYNLLGPMIVVMMSGEEMLADQVELPYSSNGHWGMNTSCGVDDPPGTDICYGQSFWLYGAQLQWDRLRSDQLAMRNDTAALFALRAAHADVLHTDLCATQLVAIPTDGGAVGYAPYARYIRGVKALLVVANPSTTVPLVVTLAIGASTLREMGFAATTAAAAATTTYSGECFLVEALFGQSMWHRTVRAAELAALRVTIGADKTPRGGISVLTLQPAACLRAMP